MAVHVRLERDGDLARVVLDTPGKRVNTLSVALLHELERLLDRLESAHDLAGILLVSAKPESFAAGADLDELARVDTPEPLRLWVERGQRALRRWEDLAVPTAAAIHGAALGGGLELALACTFRVAADDPATSLGLPEVRLGLLPALGGTHRLPRTVGLARGLDLLLTGRPLAAREALRCGLVDEVVPPPVLDRAARELLARRPPRRRAGGPGEWLLARNPAGRALLFAAARRRVERESGGHYPAPPAILAAAAAGACGGREAGERVEAERFAGLALGVPSRRLVGLFRATRAGAAGAEESEREAAPARGLVGVLGAGFMGAGIAAAAARADHPVRLLDAQPEALARGLGRCHARFAEAARRGRLAPQEARRLFARIAPALSPTGFARAELVVEAIVEELEPKRALLAAIEPQLAPGAVIASNTSTLPIAELARGLARPERVLGLHFFSPVHRMPLVEVVRQPATGDEAVARALAFVRGLGKTPVVVRDGPGFYTTRILAPYLAEAGRLLLAGAPAVAVDRAGREAGFPVGPLTLLDEVGIDIALHAARTLAAAFGARMPVPEPFARLVEAGRLGRKSGRGFHDYRGRRKRVDREALALLGVPAKRWLPPSGEIADRLRFAMAVEAVRCLEEGIVAAPADGDVAAVLGLGFPPFLGGPFRFLDALGAAAAVARLEALAASAGPAFAPPDLLREHAARGTAFHEVSS
ncbi:MAG: enoyl-CoA hydratase/isomerase family protein [Thermoanaerobaculia bacterium]|nr:enoyl-CoA hydratase/isomerase family protein [Thermoanaerobaculia bacterium]MCZ7651135.1 3-hydroxyacyl-CoA dehydrogenase NAD-binding domain-containing protein [Thermoanaerobaculia bacterium]